MTDSEKKLLTLSLFVTTGAVLGVQFYTQETFLYAIPGVCLFYGAFYLADRVQRSKMLTFILFYCIALALWFVLYKMLPH